MTWIRRYLALTAFAVACSAEPVERADTATNAADLPAVAQPVDTPPAGTPNPSRSSGLPPAPAPTVDEFGMGALRAGMTISEAARTVGGSFAARPGAEKICGYAIWREAPPGVIVMLDEGLVARVDVTRDSRIATSKGARIGDTEARIKDLYKGRVAVTPHEYTDGHYLTVTPPAGQDRNYRLVFETDGNRVLRYHGGKLPQVGYVEGCS